MDLPRSGDAAVDPAELAQRSPERPRIPDDLERVAVIDRCQATKADVDTDISTFSLWLCIRDLADNDGVPPHAVMFHGAFADRPRKPADFACPHRANLGKPDRLALSQHRPRPVISPERRAASLVFLEP